MSILNKATKLYTATTNLDCEFFLESSNKDSIPENINSFCSMIRSSHDGKLRCIYQIHKAGHQALNLEQPYIFLCHAGLVAWAVPIVKDNIYTGVVVSGRVRLWKINDDIEEEMRDRLKDIKINWNCCLNSLEKIQYMKPEQINASAQLLFSNICPELEFKTKCFNKNPAQTHNVDKPINKSSESFKNNPLTKNEKELVGRIRLGDQSAAKEILNKMFGEIFLNNANDLNLTKACLLELFISVARAAIQRYTPGDNLFQLYTDAVQELQTTSDLEEIYFWTIKFFDKLMNDIYINRDTKKYNIVEQVVQYLDQHFAEDININQIAQKVYFSSSYISHLFKEELGVTIIEYLTRIRLDQARKLLENTDLTINKITKKIGYNDITYFSKLFKRKVGISPNEYRRWWKTKNN